jgi:hypothetical protein
MRQRPPQNQTAVRSIGVSDGSAAVRITNAGDIVELGQIQGFDDGVNVSADGAVNGAYGIFAVSPLVDGGTNKAAGNVNSEQCGGVVCAVE